MRITLFLTLAGILQTVAVNSFSQAKTISLNMSQVRIVEVLNEIENQSQFRFIYSPNTFNVDDRVTVSINNQQIDQVLQQVFFGTNVDYQIFDKQIVLSSEKAAVQQPRTITGKVNDQSGQPLPGVTVVLKGTTTGAITDVQGKYSLTDIPGNATLVFSFVGMKTQEIPVNGNSTIDVTLAEDAIGIEEVVAVGYGTAKRRDVVGSIAKISSEDMSKIPATSMVEAMQGLASGVFIENNSGHPGSAPEIKIRGVHSVNLSSDPLWIIDGVPIQTNSLDLTKNGVKPVSPLAMINPNDIESVEVLKDAAATAIYGNRGSNGVIIVTTKSNKGKFTGMSINYDGGVSSLPFEQNDVYVDSETWWSLMDKAWANAGNTTVYQPSFLINSQFLDEKPSMTREEALATNTDHLGAMTQTSRFHQVGLVANKGFETGGVLFSLNYRDEKGLIMNNDLQRLTSRFNFNFSPVNSISMGINSNFLYLKNSGVISRVGKENAGGWDNWKWIVPWYKIYDESSQTGYWAGSSSFNLAAALDNDLNRNDVDQYRTISNAFVKWDTPINGLSLKSEAGVDLIINNSSYWKSVLRDASAPYFNEAAERSVTRHVINYNAYLNYDKTIGKHNITATAGSEATRQSQYLRSAEGIEINSSYPELINPVQITSASGRMGGEQYLMGIFGRINYKFMDRYILNTSIRRDGHSALSKDNRWATFKAFGLGWIISDEKFLNIRSVNLLKLRASYGQTGNTALSNSMTQISWGLTSYRYGSNYLPGSTTIGPLGSSALKWETTTNYDIGVDFGILDNRISGSVAYYQQKISDLILRGSIPISSGFDNSQVWENVGDMKNWGWEFNVSSANINKRNFRWSTDFNISFNDNEIIKLNEFEKGKGSVDLNITYNKPGQTIRKEGEKLNTWFLSNYAGVDTEKGIPMIEQLDKEKWDTEFVTESTGNLIPGNVSNAENNKMIQHGKTTLPTFYGGITNKFSYKNFDLNILFNFAGGHYLMNNLYVWGTQGDAIYNFVKDLDGNTWEKPGDIAKYPLLTGGFYKYDNDGNPSTSGTRFTAQDLSYTTQFLEKGDYIRLRSVQVGYTLPKKLTNGKVQNLRVYIGGTSLLLFTKYKGLDPETQGDLPIPRTINFGLSFNL